LDEFRTRNYVYKKVSDAEEKFTGYYFEIEGKVYFLNKRLRQVAEVTKIDDGQQKLTLSQVLEKVQE